MDHKKLAKKSILRNTPWFKVITEGFVGNKHWHPDVELVMVQSGSLDVCIDEEIFTIESGELLSISGGCVHFYKEAQENRTICVVKTNLNFFSCFNDDLRDYMMEFYRQTFLVEKDTEVEHIMNDIIHSSNEKLDECYITAKLLELTVYLIKYQEKMKRKLEPRIVNDSDYMVKVIQFVEDNLDKKITLSMVAKHLGFSESYCSKYIKMKTSLTFLEYLNNTRIRDAATLLRTTDANMTEVAFSTGFTSIQTFNRVFKEIKGVSPSEYRKRLHNKN